jgi:hypothetical protein
MRLRPVLSISLCLGLFAAIGCNRGQQKSPALHVQGTDTAVAARGTITVARSAENFEVSVDLDHLPPPERIQNSEYYVLWLLPVDQPDAPPIRAAVLDFDPSNQSGKAKATTTYSEVEVLVTAEDSREPAQPSDQVVVRRIARLAEASYGQ